MADITSQDILKATGIGNIVTLTRWHQMGLIPPPDVRTHPHGRGKMAYWPDWVLERCVRIKQLRKAGKKLSEIRLLLGDDWKRETQEFNRRRYRFAEASERLDRQAALVNLRDAVDRLLRDWTASQQQLLRKASVPFIAEGIVEKAISLMEQGANPVLVIDRTEVLVAADFIVGQQLARSRTLDCHLFVIPLFDLLKRYFRDRKSIPDKPTIRPAEKVVVAGPDEDQELRFALTDGWSFQLEAPTPRRKRRKPT